MCRRIFQEKKLRIFRKRNGDCTELCAILPARGVTFMGQIGFDARTKVLIPLFASGLQWERRRRKSNSH